MRIVERCLVLWLSLAAVACHVSRGDGPGSFRVDPESEEIIDAPPVYSHPDAKPVLNLVIADWMTNPDVKNTPYGYLINPDDETGNEPVPALERLLIDERYVPKGFALEIPGVPIKLCDLSKRDLRKGEMCIRIDRFEPLPDGRIKIEFVHTGFGFIGGAWVTYEATQTDGKWVVEYRGSFDP